MEVEGGGAWASSVDLKISLVAIVLGNRDDGHISVSLDQWDIFL